MAQVGTTVQGRLETGDQQMNDGTWADIWQFQGAAGQSVTIELRSEEFDTYLQLLDGAGNRLAEDDDSLGDLDSRITFTLPSSGLFQMVVNNFGDSRRAGIYTITLR
ncbi:MAG: PPC domain-containing protein [Gemmatimonadota bacterium]